jgi:hypothetical protein
VSAKEEQDAWAETVRELAAGRGVRYEPVGGLNPAGGPAALCPGGTNRITGELSKGFWGASCDADEHEEGGLFAKAVLPRAVLAKAHVPDLAKAMPPFNVESIERTPEELLMQRASRRKVEFESIDFNQRFLATVPSEYDPVALREMFSPGFLEWVTTIDNEIDFGVSERQLWFLWRLRERSREELEAALDNGGRLFTRVRKEVEESGVHTYPAGPSARGAAQAAALVVAAGAALLAHRRDRRPQHDQRRQRVERIPVPVRHVGERKRRLNRAGHPTTFRIASSSSAIPNAPSILVLTLPFRSITNSHGSVGSPYSCSCDRSPSLALLFL